MSSRFNPSVRKKPVIPYCVPPPLEPLPEDIDGWPPYLIASAVWVDLESGAEAHYAETFRLDLIVAGLEYSGNSGPGFGTLELECSRTAYTDLWRIDFLVWDPWRTPEVFVWTNVREDPPDPFTLRPPPDVYVPREDYRQVIVRG